VKKSVNQDDPGTYHLFYADAEGHPGSDLTFFPWARLAPPRLGHGLAVEVGLEVPADSLEFWGRRLEQYGAAVGTLNVRLGDRVLTLTDPHGLRLALVEPAAAPRRAFTPWEGSEVPADRQIRGLFGAQTWEQDEAATAAFLTGVLGFARVASEKSLTRYAVPGAAGVLDVRGAAEARRGAWGVGCVHHIAWRVEDEDHQMEMRARVESAGTMPTPVIDRFWFKSVYFREPGGVLFELATEGPGFAIDEDAAHLGETLILPPWLEPSRDAIENVLPPIALPAGAARGAVR
jgi:glyoxalase family protein